MEFDETEELCIDTEFDVFSLLYDALKDTITRNIMADVETKGGEDFIRVEAMMKKILAYNLYRLSDEECSVTKGPDNTVYLCGVWLNRPLLFNGQMVSTQYYLETLLKGKKIVYCPDKDGQELRKELWQTYGIENSSYNLPKNLRIDPFNEDIFLAPEVMQKSRQNMNGGFPPGGFPPQGFPPGGMPPGAMGGNPAGGMPPRNGFPPNGFPPNGKPPTMMQNMQPTASKQLVATGV